MISVASTFVPPFTLNTWTLSPMWRSSSLMSESPSLITVFGETTILYSCGIGADVACPVGTEQPPPRPLPPPCRPPPPPPPLWGTPPDRPPPRPAAVVSPALLSCARSYVVASSRVIDLLFVSSLLISPTVSSVAPVGVVDSAKPSLVSRNICAIIAVRFSGRCMRVFLKQKFSGGLRPANRAFVIRREPAVTPECDAPQGI